MKLVEITDEFKNSPVSKEQAIDFLIKKRKSLQHQLKSTTEKWEKAIASNEDYTRIYKLAQRRQDIQAAIDRSYNALNQLQNKYMSPRDIESIIRCNFMEATDEFQNIEDKNYPSKLAHLFRVQKARCHELEIFIQQLNHTLKPNEQVSQSWIDRFVDPTVVAGNIRSLSVITGYFERFCTSFEMKKLSSLYDKMITAKEIFQKAASPVSAGDYGLILRYIKDHK